MNQLLVIWIVTLACGPFGTPGWHDDVCEGAVCGTEAEVRAWAKQQQEAYATEDQERERASDGQSGQRLPRQKDT